MGASAGGAQDTLGLGHKRPSSDSERRGMADGGTRVPEILTAAELEGFEAGVVGPELREPADSAAMGEDVRNRKDSLCKRPEVLITQGRKATPRRVA